MHSSFLCPIAWNGACVHKEKKLQTNQVKIGFPLHPFKNYIDLREKDFLSIFIFILQWQLFFIFNQFWKFVQQFLSLSQGIFLLVVLNVFLHPPPSIQLKTEWNNVFEILRYEKNYFQCTHKHTRTESHIFITFFFF